MNVEGAQVVVVSVGYLGKRRNMVRMAELGAELVIVEEEGHWSRALVDDGVATDFLVAPVVGDPDVDARAVLAALAEADIRPDAVLTFWEDSVPTAARVAQALGLPGNPPAAVDAARSKVRTRELAAELGLPTPRARRVRSLDELFAAAEVVGFPAVVKPEFGASAMGCVRVDDLESLPGVYSLVREVVTPETDTIFRAGNGLLLEQYLDGVEFDVDLVMQHGRCVFSSVSENWPTAEPSFQETGLHCPPTHNGREVRRLVELSVRTAVAFGLEDGVLHVEGKCTSQGPRIVEVNARLGGGRIHQIVEAVWGVDLVEAQLRSSLGLPQAFRASRRPRCAVANVLVYAPTSGTLQSLPDFTVAPPGTTSFAVDGAAEVGDPVQGPEATFASLLVEITLTADDLATARGVADRLAADPRFGVG